MPAGIECREISPQCPVEESIYGYFPNLGANIFFLVFFLVAALAHIWATIRWRTWTFGIVMFWGCVAETLGYGGRIMLHKNPWSNDGFQIQICCLILAPAFFSAAIYVQLKYLVIVIGREFSRVRPKQYTWFFITCDIFALILQGAGGGIAATAANKRMLDVGSNIMLTGICWQVVTLVLFACLVGDYVWRVYRRRTAIEAASHDLLAQRSFRIFLGAITLAFTATLIRCAYRVPELSGGWQSEIMQNEVDFIVLDGVMCVIAAACLTVFHPGHFFKPMMGYKQSKKANKAGGLESGSPLTVVEGKSETTTDDVKTARHEL